MKQISKSELVAILTNTTATELTIVSMGEANMNKKDNPFFHKEGRSFVADNVVERKTTGTYDFGGSYQDRVNEALVADGSTGDFKSEGLKWGQWNVFGKVIEHNGKLYVRCYAKNDCKNVYEYFVDGKPATDEQISTIKAFTPSKDGSAKQSEAGLEKGKQIIPNNIDFDKILTIEIDGETYTL